MFRKAVDKFFRRLGYVPMPTHVLTTDNINEAMEKALSAIEAIFEGVDNAVAQTSISCALGRLIFNTCKTKTQMNKMFEVSLYNAKTAFNQASIEAGTQNEVFVKNKFPFDMPKETSEYLH